MKYSILFIFFIIIILYALLIPCREIALFI